MSELVGTWHRTGYGQTVACMKDSDNTFALTYQDERGHVTKQRRGVPGRTVRDIARVEKWERP